MALKVEVFHPDGPTTQTVQSQSRIERGSRSLQLVAAVAVLALAVWALAGIDRTQTGPEAGIEIAPPRELVVQPPEVADPISTLIDDVLLPRAGALVPWDRSHNIIVVENPQFIYELDLRTQRRTSWAPPELLVDADPIAVDGKLVVLGESGAWVGQQESLWSYLGPADLVMASTEPGRVWLHSEFEREDPTDSWSRWSEVYLDYDSDRPLIAGEAAEVRRECTTTLECEQVWRTYKETTIRSRDRGREISNSCMWPHTLTWSNDAELFACTTTHGLEIYETETGTSLGVANNLGARWTRAVLVDART